MKELSLHILDLVQNSITAQAELVEIIVTENLDEDWLTIIIKDNGTGISEDMLQRVTDPFVTSRTSRKVGLGIPLMKAACERCDGKLTIESKLNKGTTLTAVLRHSHIDRMPLGNMTETMISLIMGADKTDFVYLHTIIAHAQTSEFLLDTREVKAVLGEEVSLLEPEVLTWLKEYIKEGLSNIGGGKI